MARQSGPLPRSHKGAPLQNSWPPCWDPGNPGNLGSPGLARAPKWAYIRACGRWEWKPFPNPTHQAIQHYDFRNRERPDQATVATNKALIDYRLVNLDQNDGTVTFVEQGVRINLGGIAQGYVVDRGVDLLRIAGVQHSVVTAVGDSRLLGDRRGHEQHEACLLECGEITDRYERWASCLERECTEAC